VADKLPPSSQAHTHTQHPHTQTLALDASRMAWLSSSLAGMAIGRFFRPPVTVLRGRRRSLMAGLATPTAASSEPPSSSCACASAWSEEEEAVVSLGGATRGRGEGWSFGGCCGPELGAAHPDAAGGKLKERWS
jgi:hypothetical protein